MRNIEQLKAAPSANPVDQWYRDLLYDIVVNGVEKGDRTGTGTYSVFGRMFRHSMKDGFPLLTSKKMYTKGMIVELLWFLGAHMWKGYRKFGRTNIRYLLDNDCHIWVGDAYKAYVKTITDNSPFTQPVTKEQFVNLIKGDDQFAYSYGVLGPIYGHQWCAWGSEPPKREYYTQQVLCEFPEDADKMLEEALVNDACEAPKHYLQGFSHDYGLDQIEELVRELVANPDSRRLMVTAWNPTDVPNSVLPPCHYGFQCYTRELTPRERWHWILNNRLTDNYNDHRIDQYPILITEVEAKIKAAGLDMRVPTRELSLSWNQRSVDVPLGLPFNIASYALLLEMLAKRTNMVAGDLIGYLGDTHIYQNQMDGVVEQMLNPTYPLPKLEIVKSTSPYKSLSMYHLNDFKVINYQSAGKVNYPLSN